MLQGKFFVKCFLLKHYYTLFFVLYSYLPICILQTETREKALHVSLEMMKKLNKVNATSQTVPYNKFYIGGLKDHVDIQKDYVKWFQVQHNIPPSFGADVSIIRNILFLSIFRFNVQIKPV